MQSTSRSSPYQRPVVGESYISQAYRDKSRSISNSKKKGMYNGDTISSAKKKKSVKRDVLSSGDPSISASRSRSRSRAPSHVSNQKDYQVIRDEKGIKRKIEYPDDSDDESPMRG